MHILVFEPVLSGHHCHYLRFILEQALEFADQVTLVTSKDINESAEANLHLVDVLTRVTVAPDITTNNNEGILKRNLGYFAHLRRLCRSHQPTHIWIPYVDHLIQVWGIAASLGVALAPKHQRPEVTGLMFRGAAAYPSSGWLKDIANGLSMRALMRAPIDHLYTLDPLVKDYLQDRHTFPVKLMPEPVEAHTKMDKYQARDIIKLPNVANHRYIISLGGQNERKGVDYLIKAFLSSNAGEHDFLVLAGQCNETINELLALTVNHPLAGNIIVRDQLLSVEDIQHYLNAADYVATPYPNHIGSSSFILRAAAAKKPVMASNFGWVGWVTQHYKLGYSCKVTNTEAFAQQIDSAFSDNGEFNLADAQFDKVATFHTIDNFKQHWAQSINAE